MNKTLLLIPTFNEVENVYPLYLEIRKHTNRADLLFIDDNSPDGTAEKIREIIKADPNVKLLVREEKLGIGSAHLRGISYAYNKKYETLITMDADFTHNPKSIQKLINKKQDADVIVASRYLSRNGISDWNLFRKILAISGHYLTKKLLNMKYDSTGAFRLYNLKNIKKEVFGLIESDSYSFFFESLFILSLNNYKIAEVPIKLSSRTYGSSKMKIGDAWHSIKFLIQTAYLSKVYRDSYIWYPTYIKAKKSKSAAEAEWDRYWKMNRKKRKVLYDTLAVFYRVFIIRPYLNYFIRQTFKKNSKILHAGCGGGQVDSDVIKTMDITALDISTEALNRYKYLYKNKCRVLHGDIMDIPSKSNTYDGIYNLGVMEHLNKKEIKKTLGEFHRVLKPGGKIVLFWPPFFGISVIFLNSVHFLLNTILRRNIRLHPHEVSKVKSKKQIQYLLQKSNFRLTGYHFGVRDLFTYVVVVGEKNQLVSHNRK